MLRHQKCCLSDRMGRKGLQISHRWSSEWTELRQHGSKDGEKMDRRTSALGPDRHAKQFAAATATSAFLYYFITCLLSLQPWDIYKGFWAWPSRLRFSPFIICHVFPFITTIFNVQAVVKETPSTMIHHALCFDCKPAKVWIIHHTGWKSAGKTMRKVTCPEAGQLFVCASHDCGSFTTASARLFSRSLKGNVFETILSASGLKPLLLTPTRWPRQMGESTNPYWFVATSHFANVADTLWETIRWQVDLPLWFTAHGWLPSVPPARIPAQPLQLWALNGKDGGK